jgi:hypothetical protein
MVLLLDAVVAVTAVFGVVLGIVNLVQGARINARQALQIAEQKKQLEEQELRQDKKDRLAFLSNVIFDTSIPRESRQPFYDEYIAKEGNGPVVRFWLSEREREKG